MHRPGETQPSAGIFHTRIFLRSSQARPPRYVTYKLQGDFRRERGRLIDTGPRFHRVSQVSGTCRRGSWEGLVDPFARVVCFVTYTEGTLRSLSGGRALLALDGSKHSGAVRPRGRKPLIWRHNRLYLAALGVSKSGSGYGMVPRKHQRQIRVNGALQACKT